MYLYSSAFTVFHLKTTACCPSECFKIWKKSSVSKAMTTATTTIWISKCLFNTNSRWKQTCKTAWIQGSKSLIHQGHPSWQGVMHSCCHDDQSESQYKVHTDQQHPSPRSYLPCQMEELYPQQLWSIESKDNK